MQVIDELVHVVCVCVCVCVCVYVWFMNERECVCGGGGVGIGCNRCHSANIAAQSLPSVALVQLLIAQRVDGGWWRSTRKPCIIPSTQPLHVVQCGGEYE
jgi:hypothetical protein